MCGVRPMLAMPAETLPPGDGWMYEFKWDGVRALVEVIGGRVRVHSRLGNEVTAAYPELARLGAGIDDALVDGEIVALRDGRPSFALLQTRMHVRAKTQAARLAAESPVTFIAFDLLRLYGVDLTARPLAERRATLQRLCADYRQWTTSPAFDDGPATEAAAREHGLEGVMAKRLSSSYHPGHRSANWLKVKFVRRGEFVVLGWEANASTPGVLSSLLVGYFDEDGEPAFAGKVGSGLAQRVASALQRRLVVRSQSVLAQPPPPSPGRVATWVEPRVVVEVSFTHWAADGRLRHPVFLRIRDDKEPREVTRDG